MRTPDVNFGIINTDLDQLTEKDLNLLQMNVQFELFKRRLVVVTAEANNSLLNQIFKEKLETLIVRVQREIKIFKRVHLVEDYLTELEVLLDIE